MKIYFLNQRLKLAIGWRKKNQLLEKQLFCYHINIFERLKTNNRASI